LFDPYNEIGTANIRKAITAAMHIRYILSEWPNARIANILTTATTNVIEAITYSPSFKFCISISSITTTNISMTF
jgi:hypothetical protein